MKIARDRIAKWTFQKSLSSELIKAPKWTNIFFSLSASLKHETPVSHHLGYKTWSGVVYIDGIAKIAHITEPNEKR